MKQLRTWKIIFSPTIKTDGINFQAFSPIERELFKIIEDLKSLGSEITCEAIFLACNDNAILKKYMEISNEIDKTLVGK